MDRALPKAPSEDHMDVPALGVDAYGKIEIAPEVIQTIAMLSASQVEGVHSLTGGNKTEAAAASWFGRRGMSRGVKVTLADGETNETTIEISLIVSQGQQIPSIGQRVQEQVKKTVESMTSIPVDSVHVRIDGIRYADKA